MISQKSGSDPQWPSLLLNCPLRAINYVFFSIFVQSECVRCVLIHPSLHRNERKVDHGEKERKEGREKNSLASLLRIVCSWVSGGSPSVRVRWMAIQLRWLPPSLLRRLETQLGKRELSFLLTYYVHTHYSHPIQRAAWPTRPNRRFSQYVSYTLCVSSTPTNTTEERH